MIRISVALALAQSQEVLAVELPERACVRDALEAIAIAERVPGWDAATVRVGIWSRPCEMDTPLRDGDRVEVYRPLQADPKDQRRRRARLKPSPGSRSGP
ncbi:MAG TPA: RnfH family protein [Usitatibacter sp.]|nr:RnfH family protein [Usitatibacter sp.]